MAVRSKKQKRIGLPPPPSEEELNNVAQDSNVHQETDQQDLPNSESVDAELELEQYSQEQTASDDDNDEMDLGSFVVQPKKKKRKKGIIYISNIPKHMNVTKMREILGEFGKIGRVYLQPEKLPGQDKKKRKRFARHFTEGWVEFESKRVAKKVPELLNNKQISTRKKSQFFDNLWSMKYLPRFKWVHLTERMNYEQAVHKQRLMTEVSQARKETTFFQNNLDKSEYLKNMNKKANKTKKVAKTPEM